MALPVTSGTVATFPWNQRRVIDHASRRAGLQSEMVSAENILVAQECLSSLLNEWCSAGFPLWTREFVLLPVTVGSPDVPTPAGTFDVIHAYWRVLQPYRGACTLSTGAGDMNLFGGTPNPDVTIAGPNPGVGVNFATLTEIDTVGVLLGGAAPIAAALLIQTSVDGITYTTVQTLPSATYTPQQWTYFDLNPAITAQFVKVIYATSGSWAVNQFNFGLANGDDIETGPLNIDNYYSLPNKFFQGDRSVSAFVDRQLNTPVIKLWPTINQQGFYNGTVSALLRRYIQDPGSMTNAIEVPARAIEALIWRLASRLIWEIPDKSDSQANIFTLQQKQQRIQLIEQNASRAEALFWAEERNKSPIMLAPNLRPYTA